jgi:hypothetical protein
MRIGAVAARACANCGRTLIDPISLQRGIGPECWDHLQPLIAAAQRIRSSDEP